MGQPRAEPMICAAYPGRLVFERQRLENVPAPERAFGPNIFLGYVATSAVPTKAKSCSAWDRRWVAPQVLTMAARCVF